MSAAWTFLSNHGHVLMCIAKNSEMRLRDISDEVGITERSVSTIIADLESAGIIERIRDGRRNLYRIDRSLQMRHPIEQHRTVGEFIDLVG